MALFGHGAMPDLIPLWAQDRTLLLRAMTAGNDPRRAMAPPDTEEENVEAG